MEAAANPELITPFRFKNGRLYCENVELETLVQKKKPKLTSLTVNNHRISISIPSTPAYVYSQAGIQRNVRKYVEALQSTKLTGKIGYAIKANPNLHLVEKIKEFGVEVLIAVSGYEVLAGLKAGFSPENIMLNGNGKQDWEIRLAIELNVLLNVDSLFDAQRLVQIHGRLSSENEVKVFLRIRPDMPSDNSLQLDIHNYVNTAEKSKFGFPRSELDAVISTLRLNSYIKIVGVHCHFGSGITNPEIYKWLGSTIENIKSDLSAQGEHIKFANVGGGIGIDYYEKPPGFYELVTDSNFTLPCVETDRLKTTKSQVPSVLSCIEALAITIPKDLEIILEPGRSLIANAGALVCSVLGTKISNERKILVIDGSMNEVIRPCLYGAHHEILPLQVEAKHVWEPYDVVGPICESSDFLGKGVQMQNGSKYVAVMDVGAYCSSMASTYNMKPRASEILIHEDAFRVIRSEETFERLVSVYDVTN